MRYGHPTYLLLLLLLVLGFSAEAQRGGRNDGSNRRPNPRANERGRSGNDLSDLKFQDRLWYGAGGTLFFNGGNGVSYTTIGLTPQIGYKFNEVLSAGPRLGLTNTFVKDFAVFEGNLRGPVERRRYSLLEYSVGGFVRARYRALYIQGEYSVLSFQYAPLVSVSGFSVAVIGQDEEIIKMREADSQLQIGVGYNPGGGGVGSDIGIYYNLFDYVNSVRDAIEFRIMLTFKY